MTTGTAKYDLRQARALAVRPILANRIDTGCWVIHATWFMARGIIARDLN